ncbi:hypothetical protein Acr_12g0002740 [Actinidia rufa]|uniref:Uncharacterized protein n=1 Tax=Actinidia rufa TaxID=165716 RepID=A0A7J0FGM0_9ERIC|nr:hypothetical protein Acr_12g0002740 [Actinidia rufa]
MPRWPKKVIKPNRSSFSGGRAWQGVSRAMVMPIATIILVVPNMKSSPTLMSLTLCLIAAAAVVFLYYGNSLRNVSPKTANALEQLGTACIYASFFMAVGSHLPPQFAWFPLVCFIACVTLSVVSCLRLKMKKCPFCNKFLKHY